MHQEFPTTDPVVLRTDLGSADLTVISTDGPTTVDITGPDDEVALVEVSQVGREIRISRPKATKFGFVGRRQSVHVTVALPPGSPTELRSSSGDITAEAPLGESAVRTGSGDVRLTQATGLDIETGSGDQEIGRVSGELRCRAGSGDVVVAQVDGSMSVTTGSGSVSIRTLGGDLEARVGSGDLDLGDPREGTSLTLASGSGDMLVRRLGAARLEVMSGSGDVELGVAQGLPVWVDLAGDVDNRLSPRGSAQEGQPHALIRGRCGSGSVILREV